MICENLFRKAVASGVRLYPEPMPCVPLVEIYDRRRVLIENHQGIIGYGADEILIKVRYGHICVCGENLKLAKMSREKLVVTGKISAVNLQGRE